MDTGLQYDSIFLALSKAFDNLPHQLLTHKNALELMAIICYRSEITWNAAVKQLSVKDINPLKSQ